MVNKGLTLLTLLTGVRRKCCPFGINTEKKRLDIIHGIRVEFLWGE